MSLLEGTLWVAPTFVEGSLFFCLLLLPAQQPLSSGAGGSCSLRLLLALLQAWFGLWGESESVVKLCSAGWPHKLPGHSMLPWVGTQPQEQVDRQTLV